MSSENPAWFIIEKYTLKNSVTINDLTNDFYKTFIDEVSQWNKDSVYGIPMTKSTEVLYVNKTLLEKIGYKVDDLKDLTFEKLSEISKKSKEQLGIPGFGFDSSSNAFISTLKEDGKVIELNTREDYLNNGYKIVINKKPPYDINKYDYAAINYAGQMNYGILTGIIYSNNTLSDMRRDISRAEAVTMLNRVLTKSKNRNIINDMRYVNETKDISVFAPYILR